MIGLDDPRDVLRDCGAPSFDECAVQYVEYNIADESSDVTELVTVSEGLMELPFMGVDGWGDRAPQGVDTLATGLIRGVVHGFACFR